MRKSLLMVGIPVSVLGLGIATYLGMRPTEKKSNDSFANDLKAAEAAGVELAGAQGAKKFALSETVPETKPEARTITRKAPTGAKAVRSPAPTVKAAPEPVAADVVEEIPDLQAMQASSVPTTSDIPAPAVPRPTPVIEPAPSRDEGPILAGGTGRGTGDMGRGGVGTGGGGGGWGIFGAVIRGGGVDGDNCDPRGATTTRRPTNARMPVYNGNPTGVVGARTATPSRPTPSSTVMARPRGR